MTRIILTTFTVFFGLLAFGQLSFKDSLIADHNVDSNWFDFRAYNVLYNQTTNSNDSIVVWTIRNIKTPESWFTVGITPSLSVADIPFGEYFEIVAAGDSANMRLDFAFDHTTGTGSAWMVAWSQLEPTRIDSFKVEITSRNLVHVGELETKNNLAYPNPTSGSLTLIFAGTTSKKVEVFSIYGELVYSSNHISGDELDLYHLASGCYQLRVEGVGDTKISRL